MMNRARWSLILFITGLLIGCAGDPIQTQQEARGNRVNLLKLKIGINKEQVLGVMGDPYKTEAYMVDGRNLEFWLYMTEGKDEVLRNLTDSNFTPLAFENETLMGWGRNYYNNILKIQQDIKIETK